MEMTMTTPKIKEETVHLVRDYLKNLVKANVLSSTQLVETITRLKKPEEEKPLPKKQQDKLLTKKEVASLLGYRNTRTVDRMEKKGLLRRVVMGEGIVRFRLSDTCKLIGIEW